MAQIGPKLQDCVKKNFKKTLMPPFYGWGSTAMKATKTLWEDSSEKDC